MEFELLYKYFDGKANQEEVAKIRLWLEASPDNMRRLVKEREAYDLLLFNTPHTDNGLHLDDIKSRSRKVYLFKEFLKIASVVLIAVLSTLFFTREPNDNGAMQAIFVPSGKHLNITLPDGTSVWLNAKTSIKYPVSFNKKERLVEIDGQAYFDVAKNPDVPFIVSTKKGRVEALGTKFDVLAYSEDNRFEVMLMEGSVRVDLNSAPDQSCLLHPNEQAYMMNGQLLVKNALDTMSYEWRNGILSFKNQSMADIMNTFEKVFDVRVIIEDPTIRNQHLTGKFRTVDGIDYALKILQREQNFNITEKTNNEDHNKRIIRIYKQ